MLALEIRTQGTLTAQASPRASAALSHEDVVPPETSASNAHAHKDLEWQHEPHAHVSAFEELLADSRPYRQAARHGSDDFSIITSAGRTASWSMLSGLSLSEVSHIGIQAIPIYADDVSNRDMHDFNPPTVSLVGRLEQQAAESPTPLPGNDSSRRKKMRNIFLRPMGSIFGLREQEQAKQEQAPPNSNPVFGVPLKDSVAMINVPIKVLSDGDANMVYGRIPFVISMTGLHIKQNGKHQTLP